MIFYSEFDKDFLLLRSKARFFMKYWIILGVLHLFFTVCFGVLSAQGYIVGMIPGPLSVVFGLIVSPLVPVMLIYLSLLLLNIYMMGRFCVFLYKMRSQVKNKEFKSEIGQLIFLLCVVIVAQLNSYVYAIGVIFWISLMAFMVRYWYFTNRFNNKYRPYLFAFTINHQNSIYK